MHGHVGGKNAVSNSECTVLSYFMAKMNIAKNRNIRCHGRYFNTAAVTAQLIYWLSYGLCSRGTVVRYFQQGSKLLSLSFKAIPAVGPHFIWEKLSTGESSGLKEPESEANHSSPSTVVFKMSGPLSLPAHRPLVCLHGHRDDDSILESLSQ